MLFDQMGGLCIGYLKLKKYNTPIALVVETIWWTEFALVIDGYGDTMDRSICTWFEVVGSKGVHFSRSSYVITNTFHWSINWTIWDRVRVLISFWFDSWNDTLLMEFNTRHQRPSLLSCSLRIVTPLISTLAPEFVNQVSLTFSNCKDLLRWRWEHNSISSSKSTYATLIGGGKIRWPFHITWRYPVPPTVNILVYHLLLGKILMRDVMKRRKVNCDLKCAIVTTVWVELAPHLPFLCPYTMEVWIATFHPVDQIVMVLDQSVQQNLDCFMA